MRLQTTCSAGAELGSHSLPCRCCTTSECGFSRDVCQFVRPPTSSSLRWCRPRCSRSHQEWKLLILPGISKAGSGEQHKYGEQKHFEGLRLSSFQSLPSVQLHLRYLLALHADLLSQTIVQDHFDHFSDVHRRLPLRQAQCDFRNEELFGF